MVRAARSSMRIDSRRPAEVTADFRARLGAELGALGFAARARGAAFVRVRGQSVHRVELSSSHHNAPGAVACWVHLYLEDAGVRALEPAWRAGGSLDNELGEGPPSNIAAEDSATQLVSRLRAGLAFFDLVEDASRAQTEVCRRYVPGMTEPWLVVPYLVARLGAEAAGRYADALLRGRPELWPAFVGRPHLKQAARGASHRDHGTQLGDALSKHGIAIASQPPQDTVRSADSAAAHLRCFFGRQLRAWGEVEAAGSLRRVPDPRVKALRKAQEKLTLPIDELEYVGLVLREATGEVRPPRQAAPHPRLFQYHARGAPFG